MYSNLERVLCTALHWYSRVPFIRYTTIHTDPLGLIPVSNTSTSLPTLTDTLYTYPPRTYAPAYPPHSRIRRLDFQAQKQWPFLVDHQQVIPHLQLEIELYAILHLLNHLHNETHFLEVNPLWQRQVLMEV